MGRLPNSTDEGIIQWEVDEKEDEIVASIFAKPSSSSVDIDELLNMKDSDLLPPASPETLQLMQAYGWSVPRIPSANNISQNNSAENYKPEALEF